MIISELRFQLGSHRSPVVALILNEAIKYAEEKQRISDDDSVNLQTLEVISESVFPSYHSKKGDEPTVQEAAELIGQQSSSRLGSDPVKWAFIYIEELISEYG